MTEKKSPYNLVFQPWIPVIMNNGKFARLGIKEAFIQAHRIRQIATSSPLDRLAILRFLLALLYWCRGNPPDQVTDPLPNSFPENWFSKLHTSLASFNLLGDEKRFYQYRTPAYTSEPKLSSNYLIHEIPTGTNKWHFRHSTDKIDGLCPACCAMGLLRLPLFSTSAGRGKSPGINEKPPVYVVPIAPDLATTLRLSWRTVSNMGTGAWLHPDQPLPKTGEVPLLLGMTWLPRRVWLGDPDGPEANCISCGRRDRLIKECIFAGLGSSKSPGAGPGRSWCDPHVLRTRSFKGRLTSVHATNVLGAADAATSQWTKIMTAILETQKEQDTGGNVWVVSFATVQNDKYVEAMEYVVPLPRSPHQTEDSIERFERWKKEVSILVSEARPGNKNSSFRKAIHFPPFTSAIRPHVEERAFARARELLSGKDTAWEDVGTEFPPMMAAVAKSLYPGFTTASVQRRQDISGISPDIRQRSEATARAGRNKGGKK